MVKKQYFKSTVRLFGKHIIRLISIAAIYIVSIGLMSGIGVVKYNVKNYISDVYSVCNVYDLKIIGTPDEIDLIYDTLSKPDIKEKYEIKELEKTFTYEYDSSDEKFRKRISVIDFNNYKINKLSLSTSDSRFPTEPQECVVVESTNDIKQHKIGEIISIPFYGATINVKVVGIVKNPTVLGKSKEPSAKYNKDLTPEKQVRGYLDDYIIVNNSSLIEATADSLVLTFKGDMRKSFNALSKNYLSEIKLSRARLSGYFDIDENQILTLEECFSFKSLVTYADKVGIIAFIFISFFSLITLLVVFSTMTRLFDEDRGSMAVLKTLGYSSFAISMRYILFVLIAGLIGAAGALLPSVIVNNMIIGGFMMQYNLWNIPIPIINGMFFFCSGMILLFSIILTIITSLKASSKKPIELLTPKAPEAGKKILLERIKLIWDKLSFKYKSTCRNIFLFKGRFLMTFFSIIASTTIVFASLALFDNSINNKTIGMDTTALKIISLVLLLFSAILCALVVYNITNINISERRREIATLMVLGYRNNEVKGYICREIYIMSIMSSIIGLPCGVGFVYWVFNLMKFGELRFINWWSYILTPLFTILFAILATLFLNPKIVKTDMNESLKTLE